MTEAISPLRYPGGKACLKVFLKKVLYANELQDCIYIEPFAGGAGAALDLLINEHVSKIIINDLDPCIFAFWNSLKVAPQKLLKLINKAEINISEWYKQKEIYSHPNNHSEHIVGFATFFLNRCNRSGILGKAGPIGGYSQKGKWKIDARFNKDKLLDRIENLIEYNDRIEVYNLDVMDLLSSSIIPLSRKEKIFVYFDPPYYDKGPMLYLNSFEHDDHVKLSKQVRLIDSFKWIMTYDCVSEISDLYSDFNLTEFYLNYTANKSKSGKELLIHDDSLEIPDSIVTTLKKVV